MCYNEFVPMMAKKNHGHVVTMASSSELYYFEALYQLLTNA
jgi:short-subunit dehydrogenase